MSSRYCVFCRKPLPSDMRRDALYCSNNCRVRASYFRKKRAGTHDPRLTAPPVLERGRPARGGRSTPITPEFRKSPTFPRAVEGCLIPVELSLTPHGFAERYPPVWLERLLLAAAPPDASRYRLVAEHTSPQQPDSATLPAVSLHPFDCAIPMYAGSYLVQYLDDGGQILPTAARLVLRFAERSL